jgi:hypothetical protein
MELRSPRWRPWAAPAWTFAYGALHVWWLTGPGASSAPPDEPFSPGRWAAVTLALLAAAVCSLIAAGAGRRWTSPARWALVMAAWAAGAGLILYSYLLAISLVATVFGQYGDWASLLTRAAGTTGGVLTVACAVAEQRRIRRGCPACGRGHDRGLAPGDGDVRLHALGPGPTRRRDLLLRPDQAGLPSARGCDTPDGRLRPARASRGVTSCDPRPGMRRTSPVEGRPRSSF